MKLFDWNILKYAGYLVVAVLLLQGLGNLTSPKDNPSPTPTNDSPFAESSELEAYGYEVMMNAEDLEDSEPIKHTQVTNPVQVLSPQAYDNAAMKYYDEMERKSEYAFATLKTVEASFLEPDNSIVIAYLAGILHDENDYFFVMTDGGVPEERYPTHTLLIESGHAIEVAMSEFYYAHEAGDYPRFLDAVALFVEAETLRSDALDKLYHQGGVY